MRLQAPLVVGLRHGRSGNVHMPAISRYGHGPEFGKVQNLDTGSHSPLVVPTPAASSQRRIDWYERINLLVCQGFLSHIMLTIDAWKDGVSHADEMSEKTFVMSTCVF